MDFSTLWGDNQRKRLPANQATSNRRILLLQAAASARDSKQLDLPGSPSITTFQVIGDVKLIDGVRSVWEKKNLRQESKPEFMRVDDLVKDESGKLTASLTPLFRSLAATIARESRGKIR